MQLVSAVGYPAWTLPNFLQSLQGYAGNDLLKQVIHISLNSLRN